MSGDTLDKVLSAVNDFAAANSAAEEWDFVGAYCTRLRDLLGEDATFKEYPKYHEKGTPHPPSCPFSPALLSRQRGMKVLLHQPALE